MNMSPTNTLYLDSRAGVAIMLILTVQDRILRNFPMSFQKIHLNKGRRVGVGGAAPRSADVGLGTVVAFYCKL